MANKLGDNNVYEAKRVLRYSVCITLIIACVISTLFFTCRDYIGHIFSNNPEVWYMTSHVCLVCGVGFLFLSIFFVLMATL